ncbi:MAG: hypothetical protein US76_00375 [Parcubacteria group bacterium GW2011_GWA2_38_13b]|nr:MAG: hypothetical protein US76_00375 [Parcubacteria group bacterium GW2011_GWA2_38_13b]
MSQRFISSKGLQKIKEKLDFLKNKRSEIAERISDAKNQGDISENAEYEEAKEAQAFNEGKIIKLEETLKSCVIVAKNKDQDIAGIGSILEVKTKDQTNVFTIVGPEEVDPNKNFISNESPLGEAFMGRKKDDIIEVETPGGKVKYKIIDIR